jgi:hypothetical protein
VADPLAPLVGTFRGDFGGIRIDLAAPEDASELIEMVTSGSSELGVTEDHAIPDALVSHGLGQQRLVLILPPGSPHADGDPVGLPELGDIPFVVAPPGTSTSRLLMRGCCSGPRIAGAVCGGIRCCPGPAGAAHRSCPGPRPPSRHALPGSGSLRGDGDDGERSAQSNPVSRTREARAR